METQLWQTINRLAALQAAFRLRHLWRRRHHARAHPFDRRAHRARDRRSSPPRISPAFPPRAKTSTRSCATIGTPAFAISWRCAAIRRPASARAFEPHPKGYAHSTDLVRGIRADRRFRDFGFDLSRRPSGKRFDRTGSRRASGEDRRRRDARHHAVLLRQ